MALTTSDHDLSWRIAGLLDFEVLLAEDEKAGESEHHRLHQRDREIYRSLTASRPAAEWTRPALFRAWLEARRKERFGEISPGEEIESLLKWTGIGLSIAGLLAARAAVWSFFRSAQVDAFHPEPINVFYYSLVCIALPFLLSLYGFWVLLAARPRRPLPEFPAFLRGTLLSLLRAPVRRIASRVSSEMDPEKRLNSQALFGAIQRRVQSRKGVLAAWFFKISQCFGLAFSIGVLLFSWIDVKFHSRVFAWQTTQAAATAESVHAIVTAIAAPWAWLTEPGRGYPSLEQVRQTRFIRFRDPASLPAPAASAWAAFLITAAFVYGCLPRLILYALSKHRVKRRLRREPFTELRFDPLWHRLTRAPLDWGSTDRGQTALLADALDEPLPPPPGQPQPCLLLLPKDRGQNGCAGPIADWLQQHRNWRVEATRLVNPEASQLRAASYLENGPWAEARPAVVLVQESFMPPVREQLAFLRDIRQAIGPAGALLIALLGRPGAAPLGQPPAPPEVDIWRKKLLALGDPNLEVIPLQPPAK